MIIDTVDKKAVAQKAFSIDWKQWLTSSRLSTTASIVESVWEVSPSGEMEVDGVSSISGNITTVRVTGGVAGKQYDLINTVTSSFNEKDSATIQVRVT